MSKELIRVDEGVITQFDEHDLTACKALLATHLYVGKRANVYSGPKKNIFPDPADKFISKRVKVPSLRSLLKEVYLDYMNQARFKEEVLRLSGIQRYIEYETWRGKEPHTVRLEGMSPYMFSVDKRGGKITHLCIQPYDGEVHGYFACISDDILIHSKDLNIYDFKMAFHLMGLMRANLKDLEKAGREYRLCIRVAGLTNRMGLDRKPDLFHIKAELMASLLKFWRIGLARIEEGIFTPRETEKLIPWLRDRYKYFQGKEYAEGFKRMKSSAQIDVGSGTGGDPEFFTRKVNFILPVQKWSARGWAEPLDQKAIEKEFEAWEKAQVEYFRKIRRQQARIKDPMFRGEPLFETYEEYLEHCKKHGIKPVDL